MIDSTFWTAIWRLKCGGKEKKEKKKGQLEGSGINLMGGDCDVKLSKETGRRKSTSVIV